MGLKKYILGSLLLAIIVFGYTFSIEAGDYRVQFFDFTLILPVALWVILPMITLLILTIIHIIFYGLKNYFMVKAVSKDSLSLLALINKRLLKQDSNSIFSNENFKEIADVVSQLDIDVTNENFTTHNKEITKTVNQKFTINAGKYIPSKNLKLDTNNPIMLQNLQNRIQNDDNFALEVIKSPAKYPQEILKNAFFKAVEAKSMTSLKKVIPELTLDNDMAKALFHKDSEQKIEFAMTQEMILAIIKKVSLSNTELIEISKEYKNSLSPDQIIKLYEDISTENEKYTTAYLYVLAEYEMIDKMRDILVNSSVEEYIPFKALVDLKDAGKLTYSIDTLSYK